ncbi:MAG: bacillithiol biosynthesis cysteine-adding enzyme BshC [Planctomycetes bacterium]|nr:bacillithiol biosynthesis cysteine-adding enzyme BshC [Planctomycetota bacterium]
MLRLEHLPADVLDLPPIARAALSGRLARAGLSLPRRTDDLAPPPAVLDSEARDELVRALELGLAPLTPHVAVLDALRTLKEPRACVVVTGQQPGLCASPLYSLYKALHALRLARRLSQAWERPVVPLFWNHADDHDVAEVHHLHVLNANLDLQKVGLAGMSSGRQMLSRIVLDEERQRLGAIRALLGDLVRDTPHGERVLAMLLPRHGESLARAFTRTFTELLGPLGLVVLEPDWIRPAMTRALARLIELEPSSFLDAGSRALRAAGLEPAIDPANAALLFTIDERGRRALRPGGEGWKYDDEEGSRTTTELVAELVQDPLAWSPGALLRPLVQDLCLPVAAYVGGWGELAYHAQLAELRLAAGVPATPFVPRISITLVDPETRVALTKVEASVADVLRARGEFAVARSQEPPPPVLARLRAIASSAARDVGALREDLAELDPSLPVLARRTIDQVKGSIETLAEKAERVHQNKTGKGRRHERRLNNALFPRGEPQERVLGPLASLARFGDAWLAELAGELDPFPAEHLVLHLGDDLLVE